MVSIVLVSNCEVTNCFDVGLQERQRSRGLERVHRMSFNVEVLHRLTVYLNPGSVITPRTVVMGLMRKTVNVSGHLQNYCDIYLLSSALICM